MKKRESKTETYLRKKINEIGGLCYKWGSKFNTGVPDRICIVPEIGVFFVEVKTLTGATSKIQEQVFQKIKKSGGTVFITQGDQGVDKLMEFLELMRRKNTKWKTMSS